MSKAPKSPGPAPYNPRSISPEALAGLRRSLDVFGDLSGLVWNARTGNVVCGHQRRQALGELDLAAVDFGAEETVELGYPGKRFSSTERRGFTVATATGHRYAVRRVDWPEAFERAANVAANNPHLQGEFTDGLQAVLAEIQLDAPPSDLAFDKLIEETGLAEPRIEAREIPPPPPMTWVLLGIPTVRYGEIAERVESLASIDGIECEVSATNE